MNCPNCGSETLKLIFAPLPAGFKARAGCDMCLSKAKEKVPAVHGCDSFNSHYDLQLGEYITSPEHKKEILKMKNLIQVSGHASPRSTKGKGAIIMTQDQYRNNRNKLGD